MRMILISLLAVAVLSEFVVQATAQVPESGLSWFRTPCGSSVDSTDPSVSVRWFITWCADGPRMSGSWVDFEANNGPIARALGLPAPAAQEKFDDLLAINVGCDARPDSDCCCTGPLGEPADAPGAKNESCNPFDFCQKGQCPVGNVFGLASAYSDPTADNGCEAPWCAIDWYGNDRPGIQFSGGAAVCFTSVLGSTGHQNPNAYLGAGTSVWLGCTTESGLEIRAGFSFFGGQQMIDSRR